MRDEGPRRIVLHSTPPGSLVTYPQSGTNFFMKNLNAGITFDVTKDGHVKALKLQQGGRTLSAERKP
jgi:hypothetical protein